jgi:hypothetical protein
MTIAAAFIERQAIATRYLSWRYSQFRFRLKKLRQGLAYGMGRLTKDDAEWMLYDIQMAAESHPLMTLTPEDVLSICEENYSDEDIEKLKPYLNSACARAASKYSGTDGDDHYYACESALERAIAYAANDGIEIKKIEEE